MSEVFLDTETTGLSFRDGHKIVEIACIETIDLIPTKHVFHKLINPKRDMPQEAFNVHGFTKEFLKDKQTFDKIADEFLNFIKGKKIIIHNANFDLGFLNGELSSIRKEIINKNEVIDSLEVARNKFPGSSNSLDALCKRFNIDLTSTNQNDQSISRDQKFYSKKILQVSETDFKKHKEFLKSEIKKNFY